MRYDFELLQKVRAISPTLISFWLAPRNVGQNVWRDLCGKYDATTDFWDGTSWVSRQAMGSPLGRIGGQGRLLANTRAVALSSGGILSTVRGLFKTSWTITAYINVDPANAISGGRAIYSERGTSGNDILKLECLNSYWGSSRIGVTLRNDAGTLLQWFPSTQKGIMKGKWYFVAASSIGGYTNLYVNNVSYYQQYTGTDNFTNAGIQTWLCSDAAGGGSTDNHLSGFADAITVHSGALTQSQLAALDTLLSYQVHSFDREFPYYLVGEATAAATFQPAWASQRTRILSGGVT